MGTRWRTLYSGRGRARHHSGIFVCENRTGMERAKKVRDLRRNGCLMETETVRCIVCRTIHDTHTEFRASVFPLFHAKRSEGRAVLDGISGNASRISEKIESHLFLPCTAGDVPALQDGPLWEY